MENKYLYPCFNYWFEGINNIWVYSDPHFNDPEMIHLRKNYISDEEQVKRINSKVGKNDILIILGDIGDVSFVAKLKGKRKILIKGNHDTGSSNYKRVVSEVLTFDSEKLSEEAKKALAQEANKLMYDFVEGKGIPKDNLCIVSDSKEYDPSKYFRQKVEDNRLFDEVYPGPLWISEKVVLSHEPVNLPYVFNIHGHDHSNEFDNGHHLNVCAEHIDYTPVSLLELFKKGTFKNVDSIHRQTIDKATERKKIREAKTDEKVVDSLDYRGFHVDFLNDDYGQQVYTIWEGAELGFGAYNTMYKEDMKGLIDNKLDVVSYFEDLRDEKIYGARLEWIKGKENTLVLTVRGEILKTFEIVRVSVTDVEIREILNQCRTILRERKKG